MEVGINVEVIDPGHTYALKILDGDDGTWDPSHETLSFVKREGEGYPGNVGHHPGTTTQEVLRALIDRTKYVDNQIPDIANNHVLNHLCAAIWYLEERAARRHGRSFPFPVGGIEKLPTCPKCNHVGCEGECRQDE